MRLALVVIAWGSLAAAAIADPSPDRGKPPADAVPAGAGWWCVPWLHDGGRTIVCGRNACPSSIEHPEQFDATQCKQQRSAWVAVYYDTTAGRWWHVADATAKECATERDALLARTDVDSVAACKAVGDFTPPPAPFHREALAPTKTWWCPRASGTCHADRRFCEGECKEQASVFVVTFRMGRDQGFESVAFKSAAACADRRRPYVSNTDDLSACTAVSVVERPPIDPAIVPPGDGWFCYPGDDGRCARTLEACQDARKLDVDSGTPDDLVPRDPGECAAATQAFALQIDADTFAYRTLARCHLASARFDKGSRCEAVH